MKNDFLPPQALDVEKVVLASCLTDAQACAYALETISSDVFYASAHQLIYGAITALIAKGEPVDILTVTEELRKIGKLDDLGGAAYLSGLFEDYSSSSNIESHIKILERKSALRGLIGASQEIQKMAYDPDADTELVIGHAETVIGRIADKKTKVSFETPRTILPRCMAAIEARMTRGTMNLTTGFSELDELTCGCAKGDLILLAARPSMGKTSMAFGIGLHVAGKLKKPVAIFEMEMTKIQLIEKALSHEAEIDSMMIRSGRLTKVALTKIGVAAGPIFEIPLHIDDSPYLNITQARSICRRMKQRYGIELFIFDYLQLMAGDGTGNSKNDDVSSITRGLKGIAKECDSTVVALSQLSRACEQRSGDHRPQLSDLRDSGAIEQDADVVMFIYREEVYFPKPENHGAAEIIVAKQRNGPTGIVPLGYKNWCTKFHEKDKTENEPNNF